MSTYFVHLNELRKRLIRSSLLLLAIFIGFFSVDGHLYHWIAKPILLELPHGSLIATDVITPFTVPMRLAFTCTLFVAVPYLFFELWAFISPGLQGREKRTFLPLVLLSIVLFYIGVGFSYFLICPLALNFFASVTPPGVARMTDIKAYLDFVLTLLFAGGIAFQVPVITIAVVRFGWVTLEQLKHFRPYIIVAAFVLGMLLTPPDVISQLLLAIPMWGLFELGLLTASRAN